MRHFLLTRIRSFSFAFSGIFAVVRTQPNIWIHALATLLVLVISIWVQLSAVNWALIILSIGLVWTAELLNTAIEYVADLASPRHHPLAKVSKDIAAAAVLLAASAAALVGLLVLGPMVWIKIVG